MVSQNSLRSSENVLFRINESLRICVQNAQHRVRANPQNIKIQQVVCGHCGSREKGGTTCSQCGYTITFDLGEEDERLTLHQKGSKPLAVKTESTHAKALLEI